MIFFRVNTYTHKTPQKGKNGGENRKRKKHTKHHKKEKMGKRGNPQKKTLRVIYYVTDNYMI